MKPWSDEEHEILERYYPTEGTAIAARLPGRSAGAISVRATIHGITMDPEARRNARARGGRKGRRAKAAATTPVMVAVGQASNVADNLPTVLYPQDPDTLQALASACQYLAHFSDAMKGVGPEATRYFDSQAERLRALADRARLKAPA